MLTRIRKLWTKLKVVGMNEHGKFLLPVGLEPNFEILVSGLSPSS